MEELTLVQARKILKISERKLSALIRESHLDAVKKSGRYLITAAALADFQKQNVTIPNTTPQQRYRKSP